MKTLISKSWEFRTYSIKGTCKCSKCGKAITKIFSFQTREDVLTSKEDWKELEEQKQKWLSEPHVCNSCKKKKTEQERKDITFKFQGTFNALNDLQEQITDLKLDKKKFIEELNEVLKDKVVLYNGNEYVVSYVQDGIHEDCAFEITCDSISKVKPWLTTCSGQLIFYKRTYKELGWNNFIEVENCIITDEIFSQRRNLLNKEMN